MRIVIPATFVAVVLAGSALGLSRPAQAAGGNYWAQNGQTMQVARRNAGANVFALYQQIQQLQQQVRQLRGRIQMLEHRIKRNSRIRQRMYQKLDKRLTALENSISAGANKKQIKSAYLAAFEKLRKGQYNAAIDRFEAFVKKYPKSSYSDNAWYWLGQARYVIGDLGDALKALQTVTRKFPKSSKMPSTLFRIGVIKQSQGKTDKARAIYQRIISQYPDSDSADMASKRLNDIKG